VSRPGGDAAGIDPEVAPRGEEDTFDRTVDEGRQRLGRSWLQLIATGLLGGLDVGVGVLALLLVEHLTGNPVLSALAFAAGSVALTLARSELFTENFLVPVAAVAAVVAKGVRLVPAVIIGFTLSIGHINHAVVASIFCFAALIVGAEFGYADWGQMVALAIAGNAVGGLGLVTVLRLMQVPHKVAEARA
jgi:formate/nitrite transporter FocA (FNT family)